jgi:hypothetical protein
MVASLPVGAGVEVSAEREAGGAAWPEGGGATPRGFLWVADDSADPQEVLRFLEKGGPSVRVVALRSRPPSDPGGAWEAATHDGQLIQTDAAPAPTALHGAHRRAITRRVP